MLLRAFVLTAESIVTMAPASARRAWMDATPERFANRCLPLMMANQAGWTLQLTEPVTVEWNGGDGLRDVAVTGSDRAKANVASHFGSGIVTFKLPYLFRTAPGYNLLARGPANVFKHGISPLEGLVETDWSFAPFTMNWKITQPKLAIRFEAGEPICLIVPQRRGELEAFEPEVLDLDEDPAVSKEYRKWRHSRDGFIQGLAARDEEAVRAGWQRDYFLGRGAGESVIEGHQTKIAVRPFARRPRPG